MNKYRASVPITIYATCIIEEVEAPNEETAEEKAIELSDFIELDQMEIHNSECYYEGINIELIQTPPKPPSIED